jgi:hypothetical protein
MARSLPESHNVWLIVAGDCLWEWYPWLRYEEARKLGLEGD